MKIRRPSNVEGGHQITKEANLSHVVSYYADLTDLALTAEKGKATWLMNMLFREEISFDVIGDKYDWVGCEVLYTTTWGEERTYNIEYKYKYDKRSLG